MFIVDIIHDTGFVVSSQFSFEDAGEDGGQQDIRFDGGLGLQAHVHSFLE